eukprot:gnl/MRDRNA2_/MRDRNA2_131372_c0_seq1.p1 gnl/MRDRNA2_/MRDRNA2_131372_c0~~gnl/MRDRNA2_/MRDRNA2_131372_c0_seq1.p1  ORF type:complete len:166 (+),score=28.21 gnl/MRDRNA2_/MRDRNA2_131372_c0_seq1:63-500(+)
MGGPAHEGTARDTLEKKEVHCQEGVLAKKPRNVWVILLMWLKRRAALLGWLGLGGHLIEWVCELTHVSKSAHRRLHGPALHRLGLFAVTCIIVGHLAEHVHQEDENHHQEHRFHILEERLKKLESGFKGKRSGSGVWSSPPVGTH